LLINLMLTVKLAILWKVDQLTPPYPIPWRMSKVKSTVLSSFLHILHYFSVHYTCPHSGRILKLTLHYMHIFSRAGRRRLNLAFDTYLDLYDNRAFQKSSSLEVRWWEPSVSQSMGVFRIQTSADEMCKHCDRLSGLDNRLCIIV